MKVDKFKAILELKLGEIETLVQDNMPSKGNVESDCQRLCLINRINNLSSCINSIEQSDLH